MIQRMIRFSVDHSYVVLILTSLLALFGFLSYRDLPIDAVPDITNNQVQINTVVEGLAPEEIERSITFIVESSMRGIAGVTEVRSITRFGLSQVTVVFKDDINIYLARQQVSERLQMVASRLPQEAHPALGPISSGLGEIYQYTLDYEKKAIGFERFKQLIELRSLHEWRVKPRLLTVEGVAEINTSGGYEKQYHVQPYIQKLAKLGLHFGDLILALQSANQNVGGGYIEQTAEQILVQGIGLFRTEKDIARTPVKSLENFKTIRVSDIAQVSLGKELRTGAATWNGEETILGTVLMLTGENSRSVSLRVREAIQKLQHDLPKGVRITPVYDRSELVNSTIDTVRHNLLSGALLVILILLLLVGNLRAAVITALMIPLSLLFTFIIMKPLKISGNLMSLGALDFGIIVDGTVIVMDHCVRTIQEEANRVKRSLSRLEVKELVYNAALEIRTAAGFGELIIVAVFFPILALPGIEGKMFRPMAQTFAIALIGALILSFTTAPALASLFLSSAEKDQEPFILRQVRRAYQPILNWFLKRPGSALLLGLVSSAITFFLFFSMGGEFLPQLGEGSHSFHLIRPVNVSLAQSLAYQKKSDEIIHSFPEVSQVFSRIGTSEIATDPMGVNVSDTYIMMKPQSQWSKEALHRYRTRTDFAQAVVEKLEEALPGQKALASQPIQMRFNELLEGTRADVTVKVFGPDLKTLVEIGRKVQEIVKKVRGSADVEVDLAGTANVLKITPFDDAIDRYGLSSKEVLEAVSIGLAGEQVGYLYEAERRHPIIVQLKEELRKDLAAIKQLPVNIGINAIAPLGEVAEIGFSETFASINRENSMRRSAVLINLRGRDTESFVHEAQEKVRESIQVPEGYRLEWGGNFKNLNEARKELAILSPLVLLLVCLMIYTAFKSTWKSGLVLLGIPLALSGGILSLALNHLPFSISAGVGFIALSGIAVLNGVVLVNCFNDLSQKGMHGASLVEKGTLLRLRPVLMTALVDVFGFLPMMLSQGVGSEVQRPLASVVIGGVLSSTILTLFILPSIYAWVQDRIQKRNLARP